MIRATAAILAIIGIYWAFVSIAGIGMGAWAFYDLLTEEELSESSRYAYLYYAFHAICGYFVWIGWIFRAVDKEYIIKRKTLWLIASMHHALFLTFLLIENKSVFDPVSIYVTTVLVLSIVFTISERNDAEPGGRINSVRSAHSVDTP